MKKLLPFACLFLVLSACQPSSYLDQIYNEGAYKNQYKGLVGDESISPQEVFLINYAIVRQRPFYGYELTDKSFREILELAKGFEKNGMGVANEFTFNGQEDFLDMKITNEGIGMVRKKNSDSKMLKILKFECVFQNKSDQDVALESCSFLLKDPFGQHLTTLGYEINCQIEAGESLKAFFLVEGRHLRNNLNFGSPRQIPYLGIEILFPTIEIVSGGNTVVTSNTSAYNLCNFDGQRAEPFEQYSYRERFGKDNPGLSENNDKVEKINFGNAHFIIEDDDQPINASELGRRQ
ncbi:MAG: hypothetical protein AAF990_16010 [Bacteroidota bacterium]